MACIERKLGHLAKKKIEREIEPISTLLKAVKKTTPSASVNLVIDKPEFLIGGKQQPYDQGQLGSCTANALAFSFVFNAEKQGYVSFMPSRLDIYYNERYHMNGEAELKIDEGANISDCEYVLENVGLLPEKSWPYIDDVSNPLYYTIPQEAKDDVRTLAVSKNTMYTVNPLDLNAIKLVLTNGYTLVCGMIVDMDVFGSLATASTGTVTKIPNLKRGNLGGHAVVIVGYTTDGYFLIRNSWGTNWGLGFVNQSTGIYNYDEYGGKMRGYFKVPFAYINNSQIVSELYAVKEINNTVDTINSTAYTLDPFVDSLFKLETVIKPIGTLFTTLNISNAKLKINVCYYFNTIKNKYIWNLRSIKIIGSVTQILSEIEITNLNYASDSVQIGFYNKSKFVSSYVSGTTIALGANSKIATVLSINTSTGKMSIVSSMII